MKATSLLLLLQEDVEGLRVDRREDVPLRRQGGRLRRLRARRLPPELRRMRAGLRGQFLVVQEEEQGRGLGLRHRLPRTGGRGPLLRTVGEERRPDETRRPRRLLRRRRRVRLARLGAGDRRRRRARARRARRGSRARARRSSSARPARYSWRGAAPLASLGGPSRPTQWRRSTCRRCPWRSTCRRCPWSGASARRGRAGPGGPPGAVGLWKIFWQNRSLGGLARTC